MINGNKMLMAPLLERTLEMLKGRLSMRTLDNYRSSINKVRAFAGERWNRLKMEEITKRWTDQFTGWLYKIHGDKPQTVDFYLRTFRAVFIHAVTLSDESTDGKPFGGYRSSGSFPSRRALRCDEITRILSPKLRQMLSERQREALDVLVFILYARGMVFKDLYRLTWQMVTNGHISYLRSKTGAPIEVEVVPEIYEIMRRYRRKDSPYVFPFLHKARKSCSLSRSFSPQWQSSSNLGSAYLAYNELSEESALRRINRATREIGAIIGLSVPLTTYVPRHTWATLMLEDGHPVELIGQCMGHTSIRTTQIYLSRISSLKVDSSVSSMYDRMLRPHNVKRNKNELPDKTLIETKKNSTR